MKGSSKQWVFLISVTAINVLVATGYAIAGMIAPTSILPVGTTTNQASFIFALYAGVRTISLAAVVVVSIIKRDKTTVIMLGILAGCVQFFDGLIGVYQRDVMKSAGPFFLAAIQFTALCSFPKPDEKRVNDF